MDALAPRPWNPSRQCVAQSRSGERCQRNAHPGASVCILHGAAAPQVREAAKMRLLGMVEPVMSSFEEILSAWHRTACTGCGHVDENGVKCTGCGKPTGDPMPVIRVGQLVLDRSGFHPTLTVEQAAPPPNPFANLSDDELIERLEKLLEAARARRALHQRHTLAVIDGEIDPGFEIADTAPETSDPEVAQMASGELAQPVEGEGVTADAAHSGNVQTDGPVWSSPTGDLTKAADTQEIVSKTPALPTEEDQ